MHGSARLALASLLLALGCAAPASPRREAAGRGPADKAALYGDASLVPTREGEHARREVAVAQEIEQAIAVLPQVARTRVNVELPARATAGVGLDPRHGPPEPDPRVLVVVAGDPGTDATALPARIRTIALAVVGPTAAVEVLVEPTPAPAPPALPTRWPLLLGVLGLGFFVGVLLERLRLLRRAAVVRRATVEQRAAPVRRRP